MSVIEFPAIEFTHNDFEYIPDPFPFFEWMRTRQPVYMSERIFGGAWLFFRYDDCMDLMKTDQLSNARAAVPLRFLPPEQQDTRSAAALTKPVTRSSRPNSASHLPTQIVRILSGVWANVIAPLQAPI